MAYAALTQWEVRSTGSNGNGGGFNIGATGTDYSQSDTPLFSYTDLTIVTATTVSSVARPFIAADIGNVINITTGTGFTVQRVQITGVTGSTATVDRSLGTVGSPGGTGALGGGLLTPNLGVTLAASGNTVWVKSGTYNITTTIAYAALSVGMVGYVTTHGDSPQAATRPLINMTASAIPLTDFANTSSRFLFANIRFTTTAATRSLGIGTNLTASDPNIVIDTCLIQGFTIGINAQLAVLSVRNTAVLGCLTYGIGYTGNSGAGSMYIDSCFIYGNGVGINVGGASTDFPRIYITRSIIAGSTTVTNGHGFTCSGSNSSQVIAISGCTFAGNAGSGIFVPSLSSTQLGNVVQITSSILYGNTRYGVECTGTTLNIGTVVCGSNAYGGNGLGNVFDFPAPGPTDIILTAAPFTNSGAQDYSLNSVAGGGTACKAVGFPGVFPDATTTGYLDIGAAQSFGASGGGNSGFVG